MDVDIEAWNAWSPNQVSSRLDAIDAIDVLWAVAGGWALELFAGTAARVHDDLEIVVGPNGFAEVQHALPELHWFVAADGAVTPLTEPELQLDGTGQTWGWDPSAGCWRIDVMREPWTEDEWVYRRRPSIRRAMQLAIAISDHGVPYLAPEVVLLFKAKHQRDKDARDFAAAVRLLGPEQRAWLRSALEIEQPGHLWLSQLR